MEILENVQSCLTPENESTVLLYAKITSSKESVLDSTEMQASLFLFV